MTPDRLEALARAKINLFLHCGTRRSDGYHALLSWVVFTAIGDKVVADPAHAEIELAVDGAFGHTVPLGSDNLVLAAAYAMQAESSRPPQGAMLRLTKSLPVASGVGGGSADAAATLHLMNELWGMQLDGHRLIEIAASLGSDVPVCVYNRSAVVSGRGEAIQPGPDMPAIPVVLVNPGVALATPDVFARLDTRRGVGPAPLPTRIVDAGHLAAILAASGNDLEGPALSLVPAIGEVLAALKAQGALLARMSGSGATCFALFPDALAAQNAAVAIKRARTHWWVSATKLDC
ncbi:MAG: 4-(cytidine 5'-diphospho)-2-C-methyl-D-erythritol kinase [Alphaproteobacteria bacterium]|nr:4-(cytidine 5'-diphospho)-2-C-methyl-D-erythritol kinase [Alphaproteobacteria bacterium]